MIPSSPIPNTPVADIAGIVDGVAGQAEEWRAVPLSDKVLLLREVLEKAIENYDDWVQLGIQGRNVDAGLAATTQGWGKADFVITGPTMFGNYCNGLLSALQAMDRNQGRPPAAPGKVRSINQGQHCAVPLYPNGSLLEFTETVGMTGEVIVKSAQPEQYSYEEYAEGGVALVLGAGNYDAPGDVLTELFLKGRVCVYKPNPVAQPTSPVLKKVFGTLIERGYLAIVIGGAAEGAALVKNPKWDQVVMTGSVGTLAKIEPLIQDKKKTSICAELGGVNPWIVVPGKRWNTARINEHAKALAFAKLVNNGHVCASPQAILMAKDWEYRNEFMDRVKYWLSKHGGTSPFYPGSDKTHAHFAKMENAQAVPLGAKQAFDNQQQTVVISNVAKGHEALTREAFCPVLAEVPLDISQDEDAAIFLQHAVDYAHDNLFGSLTAGILMDDETTARPDVDAIVATMKFGIVGINVLPAFGYSLAQLTWGAFPGQTESGYGMLGNSNLYKNVEKSIVKAPFFWIGRPLVQVTNPNHASMMWDRMCRYKLNPNFLTQILLFIAIFLGI